jgi:threonine dehydratase
LRAPLIAFPAADGVRFLLKAECLQPIGSFKLRGAYNKIASLSAEERSRGVIAHSSGNHAQGVAYAARALGVSATIVIPRNIPEIKRAATAALGANLVTVGSASADRIKKAEELAAEHGWVPVPPYNDEAIIAGQGTIGLEIVEDFSDVDLVLSPVSGGGLISGIAAAIKQLRPEVKVIGVEPELAADAQASLRAGQRVTWPSEKVGQTIADGLRTSPVGEIPFAHMQKFVDDIVTVSEEEIRRAMRTLLLSSRIVAEPSGAVAPAAFLYHREKLPAARNVVAIVSGGNASPDLLASVISENHGS